MGSVRHLFLKKKKIIRNVVFIAERLIFFFFKNCLWRNINACKPHQLLQCQRFSKKISYKKAEERSATKVEIFLLNRWHCLEMVQDWGFANPIVATSGKL
jgi:hypothetical protein